MARRYILACSVFIFCRVDGELLHGLKGLSVSLEPAIPSEPADILWKYNGNKLVEFNGQEQHVYGRFKDRVTLHWHTAKLEITELRLEDSGNYDLEATINNKLHRSSKKLVVIDKVSKPTISCQMNNGSSPDKSGTLECSAESKDSRTQSLTKFEWESRGKVQRGPQLTISLGGEHDDHVHICNVSNPKSSETTMFTAKDCYPDESSSVALVASLVTTISLIIVVLGIAVAYLCYRKRKEEKKNDVEKQSGQTNVQSVSESDQRTAQGDEKEPLLDEPNTEQQLSREPAVADQPGETVEKGLVQRIRLQFDQNCQEGGKMNKGTAPPVPPYSALSPGREKKEDPPDESANLEEKKMPHQESSAAPEESGSDQTTAQAEENSTPTDGAATDQEPDRNKDEEMNNDKAPPVPPQPAEEEVPQSEPSVSEKANEPDQAGEPADSEKDKMPHQESSTDPPPDMTTGYVNSVRRRFDEAATNPPDMTTGGEMNKGTAPPVPPYSALSPRAKKEDPVDESADLEEKKMPHQESSAAPEESGSDQTTAQAEENSTPTDGAATDQEPDRNKGYVNSVRRRFDEAATNPPDMTTGGKMNKGKPPPPPVPPRSALSPGRAKKEDPAEKSADLEEKKMPHQESSAAPESDLETTLSESDGEMNKDKVPLVPPCSESSPGPAEEEVPHSEHEKTGTPPTSPQEAEKDGEANVPSDSVSPSAKAPANMIPENSAGEQSEDVDRPVSTPEKEPVNPNGDTSQLPQSPIPTKPDNEHTETLQESPDTPHKTPDREKKVKTTQDSDESNEDEDETAQCGPKEEKTEQ